MTTPESMPAPDPRLSAEDRRVLLAETVSNYVSNGYRVESQGDAQAVLVRGRRPNHLLHLILSVLTIGVWALLVWLPIATFGGERRRVITVDLYGHVAERKGRG